MYQGSRCLTFFFLAREQTELSKNFGEILDRIHQLVQDSFGFSFSKLFAYDSSQENLVCLLSGLKQNHNVIRERDIRTKFCNGADLSSFLQS